MNMATDMPVPVSHEVDVVVVGSGAAGLTAAIVAAASGCRVLVVEKADLLGGTTAWSGGAGWLPCNHLMARAGATDTREAAETYIRSVLGEQYDAAAAAAFLDNAPQMLEFLEQNTTAVRFVPYLGPDYQQDHPGAAAKARSVLPQAFDARLLGPLLKKLQYPFREFLVFGGMQADVAEALHLQRSYRSWASFKVAAKLLTRYAVDLVRFGRSTRLIRGAALVGRLVKSATDLKVEFWTGTPARRLAHEGDRVTGLFVEREGRPTRIVARKGVILASGGFAANAAMRAQFIPFADQHQSVLPDTNTGDGITMAQQIGADLGPLLKHNAIWAPTSSFRRADGRLSKWPHFAFDRCKPGAIIVDAAGQRFCNEGESYHRIVGKMHERGIVPAYLVADHAFVRKYGFGLLRPFPYPIGAYVRGGYVKRADTLAGLAGQIGIDASGLIETVGRMNAYAKTGVDPEFGKGADLYSRSLGDAEHKPNPCLGPIERGPFYALPLYPGDAGTALGLRANASAQVLDRAGDVIQGLYACGLDMTSPLRGHYPSAGTMIGPAMTFGYVAGRHVAGFANRQAAPAASTTTTSSP
ncbi:FAD-dependent oxidoreductase [Nevskia sp.]|uniref:FAD-dependent oxidoreductase n=1 Tax=Nevskia sp. TaxID=1929292 RepID=UPI0025EA551D|nr:FAD-dependent oxidoreductase [Nevskia sp.]